MTDVASWKHRLAAMSHGQGTSNEMVRSAMLAEIRALRAENMTNVKLVPKLQKSVELWKARAKLAQSQARGFKRSKALVKEWQAQAYKYQRQLLELRK